MSESQSLLARRPIRRALANWLERHQHPFSFWIHLIGIPMAFGGLLAFLVLPWDQWYWGVGAFVLGYLLQYMGHCVEGNDMGEWAGIKRLLGLPYVAISPRFQLPNQSAVDALSASNAVTGESRSI